MIDVVFFDIDGVLTDGMVYIDSEGNESKKISFDDIDAIFELKRAGVKIGFITGEKNKFSEYVKKRFSPDYFMSGCKDKLSYFKELSQKEKFDETEVCFVGDSKKDVELLKYLEHAFVPSDVDDEIKKSAKYVTGASRGNGVVREVAKFILKERDQHSNTVDLPMASKDQPEGKQKVVAIIPARGGSKGVPHKNVKLLSGKPLIHYVIESCLQTPEIDRVVISTDSMEIKEAAGQFKKVKIIDRPAELAADDITSEDVLLHAINCLEKDGVDFNTVLFLQATSPLSEASDFSALLKKLREGHDSVAFYIEDFAFFFDEKEILDSRLPRQLRKPRKREAGNAWAFRKEGFVKHKCRTFGKIGLCKIEPPKNLEIDTEDDMLMVERLLQLRERKKRNLYWDDVNAENDENIIDYDESNYWKVITDPDGNQRDRSKERDQRIADVKEEVDYINKLSPGRILDIGCGPGDLLSAVNNGWEKHGLEVSKFAAEEASQHGNIFVGPLEESPYKNEFFDMIVMHHVIEHLTNPEEDIILVRNLLKQRGRLVVATPDFDGAMARRYGEKYRMLHDKTHISLFSRISLRHFLEDFGFEIERESFPFFETRHFTKENMQCLFNKDQVSPPFWGSFMTFYCVKK